MTARPCRIAAVLFLLCFASCSNDTTGPGGGAPPPAFQLQWGAQRAGTFERFPVSAAVTNDGSIYVLETWLGATIHQFDVNGVFLRRWDAGHEYLRRIRYDPVGDRLLVAGETTVRVFSRTGEKIQEWGAAGSGESGFERIQDLALDDESNVYVLDRERRIVLKFSSAGTFVRSWGGSGVDPGHFERPTCLAFVRGEIFVVDTEREDVQRFTKDGDPAGIWSLEVVRDRPAQSLNFEDIVADADGNVVVLDAFSTIMSRVTPDGTLLEQHNACRETNECAPGLGFTLGPDGDVYILRYDGVRRLDGAGEIRGRIGRIYGNEPAEIVRPRDLAIGSGGNVFVLDASDRVREFTPEGSFVRELVVPGPNVRSDCIAAGASGRLLAAHGRTLTVFSPEGIVERTERLPGPDSGFRPRDMALDRSGFLYVLDAISVFEDFFGIAGRVSRFTPSGLLERSWTFGSHPRNNLTGGGTIAVDIRGHVWVCDPNLGIYEFTADGSTIRRFEARPGFPDIESPTGIAFGSEGTVYVSDHNTSRVLGYSPSGFLRFVVGVDGGEPGAFSQPSTLGFDLHGHLFVADTGNDRVQRFGH